MEVKMKANELRIGNLVDLGNRIAKVTEIYPLACMVADLEQTQDTLESYERVTGIPLTEEWLLKFGFITKGVHYNFTLENIEIASAIRVISTNGRGKFYLDGDIPEWMKIKLEYVHQLQNLYFALTGEEITIGGNNE
jgi:hypothetical protein